MRLTIIFLIISLASCAKTQKDIREDILVGVQRKDTIYAGSYFKQDRSKKLRVRVDNGLAGKPVALRHGEQDTIRFTIDRFERYPLLIKQVRGGRMQRVAASMNVYIVYPTDSLFSFELHQDYGKNNVVILYREWIDSTKTTFKDEIIAQDGSYRIAPFSFPVINEKSK